MNCKPAKYETLSWQERKLKREEYILDQKGLCWFCKGSLTSEPTSSMSKARINKNLFPNNFFNYPVHLHHDHKTGFTIGAVHAKCNAVLWQYLGE